ncbi:hypothetical protein PVAND_011569 [Polypedilum vanderplanki]|uniref:Uncharacterized protein n=1 Tax=Polypedilum vanderplanki TaxID=319348 RepID=A0A9J6CKJ2_POLVA|nr:hypothetical protein PVAND_011569 [Polypedilum vanderplanki]
MIFDHFLSTTTILVFCITQSCTLPLPARNTPINALNLHQNLSLHDINQLGKDQKVKALLDVQTTIDEVEKLLSADPSLPRLTKGEIKDLFEKVTSDELQKGIDEGDAEKQEFMKSLILALPYHSDEIDLIENLANQKATTMPPNMKPDIPDELKKLLKNRGLLDSDEKSISLAPLPVLPNADHPSSLLINKDIQNSPPAFDSKVFNAFKPLSGNKQNVSDEVETFLKQFGLANIQTKKLYKDTTNNTSTPLVNSAYLTYTDKKLLDSIGITTTNDAKYEFLKQDEKNVRKNTVKKSVISGPDPVKHHLRSNASKNEVKRQQADEPTRVSLKLEAPLLESSLEQTDDSVSITTSSRPSTTIITTTTTESSTTEESKKNTLEDEIEPVDEPEQLPGPRRSGFYMIFDWNTFLEVGEDPSKIVVRFDPKIGDPSRFLPVTVP